MMICGFWLPRLTFSKSLCQYPCAAGSFFIGRSFLRVGAGNRHEKTSRAFVELLADAVRYEAQWLKSCREKVSEKGQRGPQRGPTDHHLVFFVLRIAAKSTLGASLVSLFGQFQKKNSANFVLTAFSEVRPAQPERLSNTR